VHVSAFKCEICLCVNLACSINVHHIPTYAQISGVNLY
jgi:hypothetical protein